MIPLTSEAVIVKQQKTAPVFPLTLTVRVLVSTEPAVVHIHES